MKISDIRSIAGRTGCAARWGAPRTPSRQIRVDAEAAEALSEVPERDRRAFASAAIVAAVRARKPR